MEVSLFPHNEEAYKSAVSLLNETGKAAVIHPTGTGKSFIGFKLCVDNPDKIICWLSPSQYIFKTQLENLKKTGAEVPENIKFFTYSKLMYMADDELLEIKPDYIILDEFHRCGSEVWGSRVETLLSIYQTVPLLGLSATNVRYLDNRRDMAEELFDGYIASEITLGEAIARGILKAPLYVSAVYSYKTQLEKYERKIKLPKYNGVRGKAEKYLEALRRTLEKAESLGTLFQKYMPDKAGKYVVFCSDKEHMDEMLSHTHEWFDCIDKDFKIYTVYSDNPESSDEFTEFKKDKSDNLKLLFCIDMLNEGIHLDDINGVILLRPTTSPTVYKQQIGRALTAGKTGTLVIFDVINNFENLYSTGAIEQEIACAVSYYDSLGESERIVVDRFEVHGVLNDCLELFDKINDALSASWDEMYTYAEEYYHKNGDLNIPRRYKTENGLSLGNWLNTQRNVRRGVVNRILTIERIRKLDDIGMRWESFSDMNFEKNYSEAVKYYREHGNFNPKTIYISDTGVRLGVWANNLRTYRKSGIHSGYLTPERIEKLNKIKMVWDVPDYIFEKYYGAALEYYKEKGDLDVPAKYVSQNGIKLGAWIRNLRASYNGKGNIKLPEKEQIERLNQIGMLWSDKFSRDWENGFNHAKAYYDKNGNLEVAATYVSSDGFPLGKWISRSRKGSGGIKSTPERRKRLDSIGMIWEKSDPWELRFSLVKKYYDENGNISIPASYKPEGINLVKWLDEQRQIYRGKRKGKSLTEEQKRKLEGVGFSWLSQREEYWQKYYLEFLQYFEKKNNSDVPANYVSNGLELGSWCDRQRSFYQKGKLSGEQISLLKRVNFSFKQEDSWMEHYNELLRYTNKFNTVKINKDYTCTDGTKLVN